MRKPHEDKLPLFFYGLAILCAILALVTDASGQVKIVGPDKIEIGEYHRYDVVGLTEDQLSAAKLEYSPTKNVVLLPAKTWGGEPFLFFMAKSPGDYTITISLNIWRQTLKRTIVEMQQARVAEHYILDMKVIEDEMKDEYPSGMGTIVINVGGEEPKPPPGPKPKPEPEPKPNPDQKWSVVVFWETGANNISLEQLEIIASRKFREQFEELGHQLRIFDPDAAEGFPTKYKGFWDAIDKNNLPQVSVAPIEGGKVWTFALPESRATFLKRIEGGPME